jgi:FKBP-type peptidyl-prolyl cis-trans isomerase
MYITQRGAGKRPVIGEVIQLNFAGYYDTGRLFNTNVEKVAELFGIYDEERDQNNGYHPMDMIYSREAGLIPGLKEGMLNMNYGDKALLFIPAHLAYGEEGNTRIPGNTDLVYEIEIMK